MGELNIPLRSLRLAFKCNSCSCSSVVVSTQNRWLSKSFFHACQSIVPLLHEAPNFLFGEHVILTKRPNRFRKIYCHFRSAKFLLFCVFERSMHYLSSFILFTSCVFASWRRNAKHASRLFDLANSPT